MKNLNRLTVETLTILKTIYEDYLEDRFAYRNEVHRLTSTGLSLPFANLEHFLDRYGYLSIDQRTDVFILTSSGIEAAKSEQNRLKSLNDDVLYHFAKELEEGALKDRTNSVNTGKRFDQHYIRFEGIGRGGVGSVWRAEHLKTGRPVAIKTLEGIDEVITSGRKSTLKKRLERSIRQLAQLSHPFICPILDLSVHHTPPYYVMPLYSGGSLRAALRNGPLQPEIALNLFAQICLGIQHAHQQGVLHLDLKPENILLDERGNVRIFDFGMSRTIAKQVAQVGRQSYVGFGSVAYMAPELLRNAQYEAESVDIYALGLVLYEMLIGELPGRRSPMPSEVIEGLPAPVDDLFDSMTQDAIERRPSTMEQVLETLTKVPPFERLESVVMNFIKAPYRLPGLVHIDIPEIEEASDIQREIKTTTMRREVAKQITPEVSTVPSTKEVIDQSSSALSTAPAISSDSPKIDPQPEESHPTKEPEEVVADDQAQTQDSSQPSPVLTSSESIEMGSQSGLAHLSAQTVQEDMGLISSQALMATQDEVLEELEELEEVNEIDILEENVMSSTPQHQLHNFSKGQQTERDSIVHEVTKRLDDYVELLEEDDFGDDENTALHDQTPPTAKPQIRQPFQNTPKRTSSVAQQLFERHNKDKRFNS